jgi:Family of unknown function (DUF5317)
LRLAVTAIGLALLIGIAAGGHLRSLSRVQLRLTPLALVGLALQVAPVQSRSLSMALLYVSFGVLIVFAAANIRTAGFVLISLGIVLNVAVIAANRGMPVDGHALLASGQEDSYTLLVTEGGAKHHLATPADRLWFLADIIPLWAIRQVVSVGDLATDAGIMWLLVWGVRRRRDADAELGFAAPVRMEATGV